MSQARCAAVGTPPCDARSAKSHGVGLATRKGRFMKSPIVREARSHRSAGFTLIELLITVIILGILASLAMKAINAREQAYIATMKSDLKNVILSQYAYFDENMQYAPAMPLQNFDPSPGINVIIVGNSSEGFTARAQHQNATAKCAVFIGDIFPIFAPATEEGIIACSPSGTGAGGVGGKGKGG